MGPRVEWSELATQQSRWRQLDSCELDGSARDPDLHLRRSGPLGSGQPAAEGFLDRLGESSLGLRVVMPLRSFEGLVTTQSDLHFASEQAFRELGIETHYPA